MKGSLRLNVVGTEGDAAHGCCGACQHLSLTSAFPLPQLQVKSSIDGQSTLQDEPPVSHKNFVSSMDEGEWAAVCNRSQVFAANSDLTAIYRAAFIQELLPSPLPASIGQANQHPTPGALVLQSIIP